MLKQVQHDVKMVAMGMALFALPSPALAWGKTGHRVVAALADAQLSGLARAHVKELLGVESLDEAATWPDDMRSAPGQFWQKTATPWHYVTLNGIVYDHAPPTSNADVLAWWDINPRDWISESGQLRETVYPEPNRKDPKAPPELSYGYVYKYTPLMEQRLKQAGVRLAAYLNDIYSRPLPLPESPTRR